MDNSDFILKVGELLNEENCSELRTTRAIKIDDSFEEFSFPNPLKVEIYLQKIDKGSVLGKFTVSGKISGSCSRCLKPVEKEMRFEFGASFSQLPGKECDGKIKNSEIDFKDIFYQTIEIEKPSKYLCKDSCKGLCVSCGEDLNKEKCKCKLKK